MNSIYISIRDVFVITFLILRSSMKLLDHIRSHRFAQIARLFSFTICRMRQIHIAHYQCPPLRKVYREIFEYLFRLSTSVRFGATLVERCTKHSSDLNGRSTCYVRPFRRAPFSCTMSPPLPPHLLPFPVFFAPPPFGLCISLAANTPSHRLKHASARRISQGRNEWDHYEGAFSKKCLAANVVMIFKWNR